MPTRAGPASTRPRPAIASAIVLPNAAVRRLQGRAGVWTVDGGSLRFAPVRLGGSSLDGQVQIIEGLASGATVVVHSEKELTTGSRIRFVDSLAGQQP